MKHLYSDTSIVYVIMLDENKYVCDDGHFDDDINNAFIFINKFSDFRKDYDWRAWVDPKSDMYYDIKDIEMLSDKNRISVHKLQYVVSYKDITPIHE